MDLNDSYIMFISTTLEKTSIFTEMGHKLDVAFYIYIKKLISKTK